MRQNGVRSLLVICHGCRHEVVINVDQLSTGRGISPVWGAQFSPLGGVGDQPDA
jgi:hypothetical protein